jgi:hypothetical protein
MQATQPPPLPTWLTMTSGWVALGFLALLGVAILYYVFTERIDLSGLISEPNGDASMSRFQLLIFTFVIAASLFLIIAAPNPPVFPKEIPQGILILLGISSSSYLVSKGIQFGSPAGISAVGPDVKVTGAGDVTTAGGKSIQFKADVSGLADESVAWSLDPPTGMGTIDAGGLYTPPPVPAAGAPKLTGIIVVRATSTADKSLSDTAHITLT